MEFKGTKGEWKHNPRNGIHTLSGNCIALSHSRDEEKRFYDAKLIAAAPDLLEALQDFVDSVIGSEVKYYKELHKAKQAIEKALK